MRRRASEHTEVATPSAATASAAGVAARTASHRPALLIVALLLVLTACSSLRPRDLERAQALAVAARPTTVDCARTDACAQDSPLYDLAARAERESTPTTPVNYIDIVESGQDSLLARINLIRAARRRIDLQTFIFSQDDTGYLVLDELLAAARRGVQVHLLVDQLFAPSDPTLLATLARVHGNFHMRLYNPTFGRAHTSPAGYVAAIGCCFRRFNQRMHIKQMVIDGRIGITGGRNIDDRYYDWNPDLAYRDRDAIVAGPAVADMQHAFDAFWNAPRSVPIARLKDVAPLLLGSSPPPRPALLDRPPAPRVQALRAAVADPALIAERFVAPARAVSIVRFIADSPDKQDRLPVEGGRATADLRGLIETARNSVVMQTPYLVLTRGARRMFRAMHKRAQPPTVIVSTNSLASTDALPVAALAYKYSRRNLRDLGFQIHQLKPFAPNLPVDLAATQSGAATAAGGGLAATPTAATAASGTAAPARKPAKVPSESVRFPALGMGSKPAPLRTSGLRISLHAKSIVVDGHIGIIGSHNFDPRSDNYNTEGVLVFDDPVLAQRLQAAIEADIAPDNSWLTARRRRTPFTPLTGRIDRLFENLPVFDFWPFRYSTNYELVPGCEPVPRNDPRFDTCWTSVGDFPDVRMSPRSIIVRVLTAFGAGLAPIL